MTLFEMIGETLTHPVTASFSGVVVVVGFYLERRSARRERAALEIARSTPAPLSEADLVSLYGDHSFPEAAEEHLRSIERMTRFVLGSDLADSPVDRAALEAFANAVRVEVPAVLRAYRAIEPVLRSAVPNLSGRTPDEELVWQLSLVEEGVRRAAAEFHADASSKLETHGRYLETKYRASSLDIGSGRRALSDRPTP